MTTMTEKNKVALIGAGAMGGAIGTRLIETGNQLTVFDLDAEKVAALTSLGAQSASTAAEAASISDVVILSLNSPKIVRIAVFGKDGVAAGAKPGTLIIDMSSIDPEATKELAADAAEKDLRWVDSPLSGGAPKALVGQLTLMAGGSEKDVADAHRVLRHVASNYTHMGPCGAGQTTKLINQVLCGLNFLAVAEATQLALDAGVDAAKIPQALRGGRADSVILRGVHAALRGQGLPPHRPDRQYGEGPERRAGSRPTHQHGHAADGCLRRGAPDAHGSRARWRGPGSAYGVFQRRKAKLSGLIDRQTGDGRSLLIQSLRAIAKLSFSEDDQANRHGSGPDDSRRMYAKDISR
ncbi:3-hydroxyisobutyrate dehydrogenase-like beta-hydroxyacid dehydrogenase [Agrobacterium sp. SORGH_AS440]|nr:3-hydroxyisobutyrate dehydrogenase-like beta-hydroxyacid dehydrogenase [Agrobacterium sp. SORGH_AS_0440]